MCVLLSVGVYICVIQKIYIIISYFKLKDVLDVLTILVVYV